MELHAPRKTYTFTRRTSHLEWHQIHCSIIYWSLILFFCPLQQQCSLHKRLFIDLFWKMVIKETLSYCYYTAEVLWAKRRKTENVLILLKISWYLLWALSPKVNMSYLFFHSAVLEWVRRENGKAQWTTHFFAENPNPKQS